MINPKIKEQIKIISNNIETQIKDIPTRPITRTYIPIYYFYFNTPFSEKHTPKSRLFLNK
jgi:hypothetical protein